MDLRVISRFLGKIALAEGGVLFLPLAMAIIMGESSWLPFVGSIILCGLVGMSCLNYGRVRTQKLTMREGIAITGIGWMLHLSGHASLLPRRLFVVFRRPL